ncbi:MAG: hypothetical protein OHK0023_24170 [Anaerolineae bacterium]
MLDGIILSSSFVWRMGESRIENIRTSQRVLLEDCKAKYSVQITDYDHHIMIKPNN